MDKPPLSPTSENSSSSPVAQALPLDSPTRTVPIHPLLPEVRVPGEPLQAHQYDPVTCAPILDSEQVQHQLEELRREFATPTAALEAQEQTAKELKRGIEQVQMKRDRVQKDLDKKTKEMDMELKVLAKYQQVEEF